MLRKQKASIAKYNTDGIKETAFKIQESYKMIRTNLQFTLTDSHTVIFTSYEPNAGKSVSAANIAVSMAQTGAKVILIDADMRNASIHRIFKLKNTSGLSKVLSGICEYSDEIIYKNVAPCLDLLPAGPIPPNPSELLGSERMKALLGQLEESYDYVFIDSPPVGVVSDTLSLYKHLKNTVVIIRERQSRYDNLNTTIEKTTALGAKICGIVVTDVQTRSSNIDGVYSKKGMTKYINSSLNYDKDE